ncbi:MAG: SRPBCC family protein [Polyangiaceae bacterium]
MTDPPARDVTDEEGTKGLEAVFEVDAPPDALLELLWAPANFNRLFPDIKEARVVAGDGAGGCDELDVAYRVDAVVREVSYVLRRTRDRAARTITWREIGGDLRRVRGGWRIEPSARAGASRVTYRAFVDVVRFVPTGLVRDGAKRKLAEMISRVRQVAGELGGRSA